MDVGPTLPSTRIQTAEVINSGAPDATDPAAAREHLATSLDRLHAAQADLLAERQSTDTGQWVHPTHPSLVSIMGTLVAAEPQAYPRDERGPFTSAIQAAKSGRGVYCEGYRVPLSGGETTPLRHAWTRDPVSGVIFDEEPATSRAWLYLGVAFTPAMLRWFYDHQPGDPLPEATDGSLVSLDYALDRTLGESLDDPLPLDGDAVVADAARQVRVAITAAHQSRHPAPPADRAGKVTDRRPLGFMGVLDHVGSGIECLKQGLVFVVDGAGKRTKSIREEAQFRIVAGFGDPPPF